MTTTGTVTAPCWADPLAPGQRRALARKLARGCKRSWDEAAKQFDAGFYAPGSLMRAMASTSAEMADLHLDVTERAAVPARDRTGDAMTTGDAVTMAGPDLSAAWAELRAEIARDAVTEQDVADDYSEARGPLAMDYANQHWGNAEALRGVLAMMDRAEKEC